ncbi:MAG: hypothetical protein HY280_03245 [Nitrospinae bacterium]|nr:hypothetical protein [Nitrospinota bacterium]
MKNKQTLESPDLSPVSPYSSVKASADDAVVMHIFSLVEKFPHISEKKITAFTGIAAGLAHSFMRKVMAKGWIKARQVSAKRWLYYMTPEGFAEKGRLTARYLGNTLRTYKVAQKVVESQLELCKSRGWQKLAVAGSNELADIAALNITSSEGLVLVGRLVGDGESTVSPGGTAVFKYPDIKNLEFDKVLVCEPAFVEWTAENNSFDHEKQLDVVGRVMEMSF